MARIVPFFWFDKDIDGIIEFYKSVFPDLKVSGRYTIDGGPSGSTDVATLEFLGFTMPMMTAGPMFSFTEAISLQIYCDTQDEIDYYFDKLCVDPEQAQCGWIKDRYGLTWQVIPSQLESMMAEGTPEQARRVAEAFMPMKKLDMAAIQRAFDGK